MGNKVDRHPSPLGYLQDDVARLLTLSRAVRRGGDWFDLPGGGLHSTPAIPANIEPEIIKAMIDSISPMTESRVREIVRDELLDFRIRGIRADPLFRKILKEIG